jgi:hypothetical protein
MRRRLSAPIVTAALVSGAATAAVILVPALRFAYRLPDVHVTLETAAALIGLLAAYLVFGRFRRSGQLADFVCSGSSTGGGDEEPDRRPPPFPRRPVRQPRRRAEAAPPLRVPEGRARLGQAALEKRALDGLAGEVESPAVRGSRLVGAPEPAEEVGAGGVKEVIGAEVAGERLEELEAALRAFGHGDGDGAVQLHDG